MCVVFWGHVVSLALEITSSLGISVLFEHK